MNSELTEALSHTPHTRNQMSPTSLWDSYGIICWIFSVEPIINTTECNSLSLPVIILVRSHRCTHTHKHTHLCLALSLSKQPFYSERLQWSGSAPAKTPFHTSSLPFSKPSLLCDRRAFLPSFLLTQRPGGVAGESGWPDVPWSDRHTDWQGTDMQTEGCCCYRGLWAWFCSHPEL